MALYAFDGTWNEDEPSLEKDTNVVKFANAYTKGREYVEGVGTRFSYFGKIVGGLTGAGGRERIAEMYKEACENFEAGDEHIDVIGFSRGAALAVHFCNVLERKGLELARGKVERPRIRFLGVWDIVGSFGIPFNFIIPFQEINLGYDLTVPDNVARCFHAMAQDELRQSFRVTRLDPEHARGNIEEVWFRGVHSDVGGGNGNFPLNNIALGWMLEKAAECGLPIDPNALIGIQGEMDATVPLFENFDPIENKPRPILAGDVFHHTAFGKELRVGEEATFRVDAPDLYSWTGVRLVRGGQYLFRIPPGQEWTDASIECGPDGWRTEEELSFFKGKLIKFTEGWRRHPEANWFEVIGAVGKSDDHLFRIGDGSKAERPFVSMRNDGLYAFANDIRSMYDNNKGTVNITVRRVG